MGMRAGGEFCDALQYSTGNVFFWCKSYIQRFIPYNTVVSLLQNFFSFHYTSEALCT
jgi:hypothetical protein